MKTLKIISLLFLALSLSYCSNEEEDDSEEQEQDVTEQENIIHNPNTVIDALIINGANKIEGNAPLPTGNLSFSIENTSTALINEGFNISFNSSDNLAGAYLIISDIDGNEASSYFDIPESAFNGFTSPTISISTSLIKENNRGQSSSDIIINFLESLTAGKFCYTLCVYDNNGNISQPQTVCITIQALGGNNDLIDKWFLSRFQENYDGMSIDVGLNEEFCYSEMLYCYNGNTLNFEECETITEFYIDFSEDGIYRLFLKIIEDDYDWEASQNSCTIVGELQYNYEYLSEGFWAFNTDNNRLFMASYYNYYNENGEIEEEFLGAGNAQLLFDIPISLSGNTFVLNFSDGGEQLIYTFQK